MTELFGWLSAFFLGICGLPQAWHSYKIGKADDISLVFLVTWILGEIFGAIYVLFFDKIPLPLLVNYILNTIIIVVVLRYKLWPRKKVV